MSEYFPNPDYKTGIAIFPHVDTSTTFNLEFDSNAKKVNIKSSSNNPLLTITGDIAEPRLNVFHTSISDIDKKEAYVPEVNERPVSLKFDNEKYTHAIFVTMLDNKKLTITGPTYKTSIGEQSFTFGTNSSIVVEKGGLLVIGGSSMIFSSPGYKVNIDRSNIELDTRIRYLAVDRKDMTLGRTGNCSHNSIVMGSGSTMTIKYDTIIHVGASVYGNANVTFSNNATLTVGDGTTATYLNIGASNNKSTNNAFNVSGTCVIENSWVNLGGGCSVGGSNRAPSNSDGHGGMGSLSINNATISKSRIYCGSGAGAGTVDSSKSIGGNGSLTTRANITNSIIYLGGAGSYYYYDDANRQINAGNGGNGSLTVDAPINNSIVLVGSSGGSAIDGSFAGGGIGSNSNGCNGILQTDSGVTAITNTIISLGLPAIRGPDADINAKVGKIEHSVVFCGTGNYGNNYCVGGGVYIRDDDKYYGYGGAAGYYESDKWGKAPCVAISGFCEGYLGQQPSMVFNTMTPGVLSLPSKPTDANISQTFGPIGEFPRVDNSSWAMTEQKTINISNFGISGVGDNRTDTSPVLLCPININSGTIIPEKFANFGGIIVNPNEPVPSKTITNGLIRISDESVDITSKNFNDLTIANQLHCGFIVNNKKPFYINPSKLVVGSEVTLDSTNNPFSISASENNMVLFSTTDSTIKSSGNLSIDGMTTFKGCELGTGSRIKSPNATIDSCKLLNTDIQSDKPVSFSSTDLTSFEAGTSNIPLKFPLKMENCTLAEASKITQSGTTSTDYALRIVDSTIMKGFEVNSENLSGCTISGCTFKDDIKTVDLQNGSKITNCEFGSGVELANVSNMEGLIIDTDVVKYESGTSGGVSDEQYFNVTLNNGAKRVELYGAKLTSPTSFKPVSVITFGKATSDVVLSGDYSTNIRKQLVSEKGIKKTDVSITVGTKVATFEEFSLGSGTTLKFENGERYESIKITDGMNVILNTNIDYIDFSTENGLTVLKSNCGKVAQNNVPTVQSSKIIQNNITINALNHYKGSILKYDSTEFLTDRLALCNDDASETYQLEISNNSLKNLSDNALSFISSFVIGKTEVLASEANPFTIVPNAVCQFIGTGQYIPTESEYATTTFLNGEHLTISNGYVLLEKSGTGPLDFSGFALKIGDKTIDIKGHLKIDNMIQFKIESDITISEDTTLEIDAEANAKVTLKGNVEFIGKNFVKIDNVVVQIEGEEAGPREIIVDFGEGEDKQTTFNNSSLTATSILNAGTIDLTNSIANFGKFVNNGIFTMISSKTTDGTSLGISNNGATTWFNAEIEAVNNGTLSIANGSSICPRNGLEGPHLSFVGNFSVGSLNLSQDGILHICGKASETRFDGSLQINTVVYLGDSEQILSPISSTNANTSLIINSDKYASSNPFRGQLLMGATNSNAASLQINSSGLIDIPKDSTFKVWSNVASQKAVINGIFKSTIGGKTFEYNDNMTLNGMIEMERDVIVKGKLQITSNGKLYIGQSAGANDIPGTASASIDKTEDSTDLTKWIIIFTNFDKMPSTQLIRTVSTIDDESVTSYSVISTNPSKRIIPVSVEVDAENNASITYSNGVILKLTYSNPDVYTFNTFETVSGESPNIFFGSASDVYISNLLEIFGTFYNNNKLTVNARLTCVAGSSVINNGTISVRSDNDNVIIGNVLVGNSGALTFNGTYNDHSKFNLVVNERSGFVVNDSIIISSTTNEIDVLANSEPQIHTVLVNDDIVATKSHYVIKPKKDDTKASTYTSLTDVKPIDDYAV